MSNADNLVHITVDHDHMQKNVYFSTFMLEHLINDNYQGAVITTDYNIYGLLTDIWIKFQNPQDAVHFKLCHCNAQNSMKFQYVL